MRATTASLAAAALTFAGCGGDGARESADGEDRPTYTVSITEASFPAKQHLAEETVLTIAVRNTGDREIPNIAATIEADGLGTEAAAFGTLSEESGLSSRSRPVWIVDDGPHSGDTAYANTWALGSVPAGEATSFTWKVAAIRPGRYRVTYRLSGDVAGASQIVQDGGKPAAGTFAVTVTDEPGKSRIDANGDIVRVPAD